jgi:anti-sigma regulatory factor (Ser/Thr protein kinase)
MRHALNAFLEALEVPEASRFDVVTAVGEALANAVEHAYRDASPGEVELHARMEGAGSLTVEVVDRGSFAQREERPHRGFGLRIVRAVARSVRIDTQEGTAIQMVFDV